jgi:uncharacterized membrane protein YbaN (DUF454 family)
MKKYIAILLTILGIIMVGLSIKGMILPPGITGVGFIAIAVVFLRKET